MNEQPAPVSQVEYDGIHQLDNPVPVWWKRVFLVSIVFCICYLAFYHVGAPGRSVEDRYDAALAANTQLLMAKIGELQADEETILRFASQPNWVRVGQTTFKTHCISCHGRDGEGKVGPNLTDDHYKNVRQVEDIATVLVRGAGNGAMPAWGDRLSTNEIVLLSAYVVALRGTNHEGGKAAEGSEIAPWPDPPPETEEASETSEATDAG